MTSSILLSSIIIILCIIVSKISIKVGVPSLLLFLLLGMAFGSDGLLKIQFDDYKIAEQLCTITLIFIMFYGGFGTNWNVAKPVAKKAFLLSFIGTFITSMVTGALCYFVLKFELFESFLIGSVIGSTDAASVFSSSNSIGREPVMKAAVPQDDERERGTGRSRQPCPYLRLKRSAP